MNGKAPNWPATGSQTLVRQKLKPNRRIDSIDSRVSRRAMPATRTGTRRATRPVAARKARPSRERRRDEPPSPALLDATESIHLERHDALGKRRVAEVSRVLLPLGQGPLDEVDHLLRLGLVLGALV